MKLSLVDRIFERSIPEPNTGCLLWDGASLKSGYGVIRTGSMKDGTRGMSLTHRVICEAFHGLSDDQYACHKCDNPSCVNPDHLFPETCKENMQDALRKGRLPSGDNHRMTKVTSDKVLEIRADRRPSPVVAKEYGISPNHVRSIWCGAKRNAA
jgi:hypothetical protein